MQGEHLLHAHAVGNTTHGEGLLDATVLLGDDGALEHLDTLTVAFLNADVHTDGVAHVGHGSLFLQILVAKLLQQFH